MTLKLHSFGQQVLVSATSDGLDLHSFSAVLDWERPESWPAEAVQSSLGKRVSYEVATVLEMELASSAGGSVLIPYGNFAELDRQEIALHKSFSQPSPFLLHIDRSGVIGRPDFQYKFRYMLGGQPVPLERTGTYLRRASTTQLFHMDPNHFALVDAMERFNALPPAARRPQPAS